MFLVWLLGSGLSVAATIYILKTFSASLTVVPLVWQRDFRILRAMLKLLCHLVYIKWTNLTVPGLFRQNAQMYPDRVILVNAMTGQKWTYSQVDQYSNRVANYFKSLGIERGETVAIFMENRPEYLAICMGLFKAGLVPALINYNLRHQSLLNSLVTARADILIAGAELIDTVESVHDQLEANVRIFCSTPDEYDELQPFAHATHLNPLLESASNDCESYDADWTPKYSDVLLYIYTSGTTGFPKAVPIKHLRQFLVSHLFRFNTGLGPTSDVIYCCLPMYHSSGFQIAGGLALLYGIPVVIDSKFSASHFFTTCAMHDVTASLYIGEILRYLLATPKSSVDKLHKVRTLIGNGLREPKYWQQIKHRFNVENIVEFYGSTEGNASMVNLENKAGSCGFIYSGESRVWPKHITDRISPLYLVQIQVDSTGNCIELLRDDNGRCKETETGQVGELIGRIVRQHPTLDFVGYRNDKVATNSKQVTDVFSAGDVFFRTGDLFVRDAHGWLYFHDRTGDTFRWRGENTSTSEVERIINTSLSYLSSSNEVQLVCYGVEVPNCDGKAGMLAIVDTGDMPRLVILADVADASFADLPSHSRPLFVRFVSKLETTGTHKLIKTSLASESFHVDRDSIFMLDVPNHRYQPMTDTLYSSIMQGTIRI